MTEPYPFCIRLVSYSLEAKGSKCHDVPLTSNHSGYQTVSERPLVDGGLYELGR
jgi:hypothetical protein